ncbi:MAG: hypothetical protein HQ498_05270 [Pseudohongiella sp.]|nr:hypothetical protein [Pseudohongiella sp.]
MKAIIVIAFLVFCTGGIFAFNSLQKSKLLQQQLVDYERQVTQLLSQVESNSRRRLDSEKQIQDLKSQLTTSNSQLTALSNQLQTSQQQLNPDYQQLEDEIRQQLSSQMQQQSATSDANSDANSRVNLLKQLAALDPVELGELMSLQGQFGGFLQSLNVSDERMEVIVGALDNLIADQNQARMDLALEMQSLPADVDRRDVRFQMRAIMGPEAQREALAYELSESELDAFAEFQSEQQKQNSTSTFTSGIGPGGNPGLILRSGPAQGGRGIGRAIRFNPPQTTN